MKQTLHAGLDALTDVLDRDRLSEALARTLASARRHHEATALCVVDLDLFRLINEAHGHPTGDGLLRVTAEALAGRLRGADTLGRLGGDAFGVVLARTDTDAARAVADDLLATIRSTVHERSGLRLTASAGVAGAIAGDTAADVLARAELAVRDAKATGRDRAVLAGPRLLDAEARARETLDWAEALRTALESGGLDLHAQPIVALDGAGPPRYELLVRLRARPDIGSAELIATAERFGQIQAVDGWVCARALDFLTRNRDAVLHVNLAAASIGDRDLMAFVERAVRAADLAPGRLVFEITESAAIADLDAAAAACARLRALGCRMALDDFGAGFASFAYLKRLPFDILKIDGDFVRELPDSPVDRLTVEAMATIGHGLNLDVVAEYVGNAATVDLLQTLGVRYAQGYHCGRPRPAAELVR